MSARLPLQVGRAALGQSARFAATAWLGPACLILAAMFHGFVAIMILGVAGLAAMAFAVDAADAAKRDRPSDVVLDGDGLTIEGGPLDGKRIAWHAVADCKVVEAEPRRAIRWLVLSWLTGRSIAWLVRRARVPVLHLRCNDMVLAEGEGDDRDSLESLRDAILGAAAPPSHAPPILPQEILTCPQCSAAQVPIDQPAMACPYCAHQLDVPAELRERLRARDVLDKTSAPQARVVARLVAQPSARRAVRVVVWARRVMVWTQPLAIAALVALMIRATSMSGRSGLFRTQPSDDAIFFYNIALLAIVIIAAFIIMWTTGAAYLSNRRALRILTEGFGAIPPVKPGAPSSCRKCGAPLPDRGDVLLVHCVYCATENVLGVDPRPAAFRRTREDVNLHVALRHRRFARLRVWLAVPLGALLAIAIGREVVHAWWIPPHVDPLGGCAGHCGTITNADRLPRTVEMVNGDEHSRATVVPHGELVWSCFDNCTIFVGSTQFSTTSLDPNSQTALRIEHGSLHPP